MAVIVSPIPEDVEEIGRKLIGCGIAVHRVLGPGYKELIYQRAFAIELEEQGMSYESEKRILIPYRQRMIGGHKVDFLVDGRVIVELKSVPMVKEVHRLQVRSYLKAANLRLGYVMNFNQETFTAGCKRVVL
jgi:GxxExxY protein